DDQPFFLYLAHYAVHSPFQSDKRFAGNYESADRKKAAKAFATLIEGMDKSLGDLMDHVEARGIANNTVIFFLGDNGSASPLGSNGNIGSSAPLRGKKGSQWEGGIRVPFIAAWLKQDSANRWQRRMPIKAGGFGRQIGSCFDLFPTITDLAEASLPSDHLVDGHSLAKLLRGGRDPDRLEYFLSHFPHPRADKHFTTYREGDWKLIYHHLRQDNVPRYALYHLKNDPTESADVSEQNPETVKRLTQSMAKLLIGHDALYPSVDGRAVKPIIP
ncbi:MAG: sulfatase-like hydrolase/transferase, partial [Limisphaerales bacterium]